MPAIIAGENIDRAVWDRSLAQLRQATPYHLWGFSEAVQAAYGLAPLRFALADDGGSYRAVLALFPFGRGRGRLLVSLPYSDCAGLAAACDADAIALLDAVANALPGQNLLLRQAGLIEGMPADYHADSHKVRMLLTLGTDKDQQLAAFKPKLRAQIKRPIKDGFYCRNGGVELLDDFWCVFARNMRELGSPVHSRDFLAQVLEKTAPAGRIFIVYAADATPAACAMVLGINGTLGNPWASSDRRYQRSAPNMLLYWSLLTYAMEQGYAVFDFGRSTPGEGTYRFKAQWGAEPAPLYWYSNRAPKTDAADAPEGRLRAALAATWRRLPLPVANRLGPLARKRIHL